MREGCTEFPAEFAERYIREKYWAPQTIAQAVAASARNRAHNVAMIDEKRELTFRALLEQSAAIATTLGESGLRSGDRMVTQLPNCVEFATLLLACLDIGALPVMALPAFRRAELEYLVNFSSAKAIAVAPEHR